MSAARAAVILDAAKSAINEIGSMRHLRPEDDEAIYQIELLSGGQVLAAAECVEREAEAVACTRCLLRALRRIAAGVPARRHCF
ncbi:MAG: hypothetical protein HYY06_05145 [Deltaproteobacteria bacterium]|nr:hypothetical protein [Deltaproteobacteria bacterium]